jgi:hypothetical protein
MNNGIPYSQMEAQLCPLHQQKTDKNTLNGIWVTAKKKYHMNRIPTCC